ncbi:MAG: class I SAM-dependent methyltransferase [Deltaproteobacteria bacterium]|nr:class I SAM-dependent methyltransferase [Deltaproteobacteria bacterium]
MRKLIHNPEAILGSFVRSGDTALDVGPGMGYFTIPLAGLVGPSGRVIAADIQQRMLDAVLRRARRGGVADRIQIHLSTPESIGIDQKVDFVLAFWIVHEIADQERFFEQIRDVLKPSRCLLLAEPIIHVTRRMFSRTLGAAKEIGLTVKEKPRIALSHSALLEFRQVGP